MPLFSRKHSINSNEALYHAIEDCKKEANSSAKAAKQYVLFIKKSIAQANEDIKSCVENISKLKIRDEEVVDSLKRQLLQIETTFYDDYHLVEMQVEKKAKESNEFNITLFGRTKVGKSTLMEILTNGDGSSIGKGGQRTTLNVRKYQWRGLTITDVPGIDAFNGATDDRMALDAAKSADIVLFMISDGQPEYSEAEWLVRLKQLDKPIICICNAKRTLDDELDMEMFLDNPNEILCEERIQQINAQFNAFVKQQLPKEHIDILVTQLQARFLANKKEYAKKRTALIKASQFNLVEDSITEKVIQDGIAFRRKCYLSIVDNPLYHQALMLLDNSAKAYTYYLLTHEKMQDFCEWQSKFVKEERTNMLTKAEKEFDKLIATIPLFVEENLEKDNVKQLWAEQVSRFNLETKIQRCYMDSFEKAQCKIDQLFASLNTESKLQSKMHIEPSINTNGGKIVNWRRIWEWTGAGIGTIGGVMAFFGVITSPIGWIISAGTLLCAAASWLCDSREDKVSTAKDRMEKLLTNNLKRQKKVVRNKLYNEYENNITKGLLSDAYNRLYITETTLLTLANSQRELALKYLSHHIDISKQIVLSALYETEPDKSILDHIDFVARVPGKKTIIGSTTDQKINTFLLSQKIGNKEEVWIFRKRLTEDVNNNLNILKCYFRLNSLKMNVKQINGGFSQSVVYIPKEKSLTDEDYTNLQLIQQILNVHIIRR